jgi:hypothetical protein
MSLTPAKKSKSTTKSIVEVESVYGLDHGYSLVSSRSNAAQVASNDLETKAMGDTVAVIEANTIHAGHYILRVSVPKANWMSTKKFNTCLKFEFYMNYHELKK